ncbi:MAG: HDIG domain-containing protein [Planctomycetaceae bacterium]
MSWFGSKSSRASRTVRAAEIGVTSSLGGWLRRTLGDRGVQLRLLMCLGTVAAMLTVVEGWRPPQTQRIGDRLVTGGARQLVTASGRRVQAGQVIDAETLKRVEELHQGQSSSPTQQLVRGTTVVVLLVVLMVLNGAWLLRTQPDLVGHSGRLGVYLASVVLAVGVGRLLSFDPWRAEVIPLLVTVVVFAIAWNQVVAIVTALTISLLLTLSTVHDIGHFIVLFSVSATAILPLTRVSSRSTLIKVGFWSGVVYVLVGWGTVALTTSPADGVWWEVGALWPAVRGFLWCLVAGYLVAGSLPFIESTFGVVTDISLLEMGDVSHPLLQELVQRAPGTYNHSIVVGTIGEAAADRIGANGLLVRVAAYFHDIGKMLKPEYFIENTTKETRSRHEQLAPAMSTLIIIGHVKDGVELARQHNLPSRLIDFIEQHHGTTVVEYFFHEAERQAGDDPDYRTDALESSFRYPGPRPQTREAGVMMLADAVESASRTVSDPTPKRLESLVHRVTINRLLDGQFEQSGLTLTDLSLVEESLTKSLTGIYHGRVTYPEQRTA